jgi:hypothetical protein
MSWILGGYPWRVRLGLALVLLFAAMSGARWLRITASAVAGGGRSDEVTLHEARLQALRPLLPPGSTVGYLADPLPADLPRAESRDHFRRYVLTQYALAPVLVQRSAEADLVVGNFVSPPPPALAEELGLVPLHDLGEGILLLRRSAP